MHANKIAQYCSRQSEVNHPNSGEHENKARSPAFPVSPNVFQCLFCGLLRACAKGFLNPPQSPLSPHVPAAHLQSARPSAAVSQVCPRPCIVCSKRRRKDAKQNYTKQNSKASSQDFFLPRTELTIPGHNKCVQKELRKYEHLVHSLNLSQIILIYLNLLFFDKVKRNCRNHPQSAISPIRTCLE